VPCAHAVLHSLTGWYLAWNPFVSALTAVELFVRGSRPVQGSVAGVAEMRVVVSVAAHSHTITKHVIQLQACVCSGRS